MKKAFNATEEAKKLIGGFSEKDLISAQTKLAETADIGASVLEQIRIPILSSDKAVAEYVELFELSKPENFVRYLVEAAYAPAETICDGINSIRNELLNECVDDIRTCKENYLSVKTSEEKRKILGDLKKIANRLEGKITIYIEAIQAIDNRPKWQFFIGAKSALKEIDANVSLARIAVASYVRSINLYMIIASQCGEDSRMRLNAYESFMNNALLNNGNCRLMHEYDINKNDEFWLNIPKLKEQAFIISEISNDIAESEDFDFNNIDFT